MSRVVLVTGGSSGIGRAIATHLSRVGYTVYGTSRKAESGKRDDNFTLVNMDVTDETSVISAINYVVEKSGGLDVLINNAGLGMAGPIENSSAAEVEEIFRTNVFGVMNVCRHAIPFLRKSSNAFLVNITSIGGKVSLPYRGIYCSSKYAIEGITETLSMELSPWKIKVCIVEPGDFKTNINDNRRVAQQVDYTLYSSFDDTLAQIHDEVQTARDPMLIGKKIESILKKNRPQLRYKVATFTQRLSVLLKAILPDRMFEFLIMNHYKLKK